MKDKARAAERMREWRRNHPGYAYAMRKAWKLRNPDKVKAADKRYEKAHKSQRCAWSKASHQKRLTNITYWAKEVIYRITHRGRPKKLVAITYQHIIDIWFAQNGMCAFSGLPMNLSAPARSHDRPSLDRINCAIGYIPENIRLVWQWYNIARGVKSDNEMAKIIIDLAATNRVKLQALLA